MTRRGALYAAAIVLGAGLFARSVQILGAQRIHDAVLRVGWGFLLILFISGAREAARTLAWMRTIEGPERLGFADAFRARLAGEAFNTLLPMGMLVGEPAKAAGVRRQVPFPAAFTALMVEFAFYCASLVPLLGAGGIVVLAALKMPATASRLTLAALLATTAVAIAAATLLRAWLGRDVRGPGGAGAGTPGAGAGTPAAGAGTPAAGPGTLARTLEAPLAAFRHFREMVSGFASRHPEHLWPIVAFESAFQVLAVAEVYITLMYIGSYKPTVSSAVALEAVGRAITMVFKVLPLRIGIDEAGASLFAGRLDLGIATGITLALVRKARLLFWSAVGLLLLIHRSPDLLPVAAPSGAPVSVSAQDPTRISASAADLRAEHVGT